MSSTHTPLTSGLRGFWDRLSRPVRELRWRLAKWSTSSDRAFHDSVFSALQHDPFSPSYPGNLTIRRFADLAARHLGGVRSVLDLGCGPGEITCELARRHPSVAFTGFDHSPVAIDRARSTRAGWASTMSDSTSPTSSHSPLNPLLISSRCSTRSTTCSTRPDSSHAPALRAAVLSDRTGRLVDRSMGSAAGS